ncbi:hypothetical protein SBOR_3437 [Sclerotinia borealis F-4128]|uniref:DUF676 domain-containing protein n=1 Tax=Sclerotinia borealis (strain F-4128) TaxID=1432307 RepID=W9CHD1_SCLBF|nr:hypothetical protein SBOR_3437 [Sclerotinia borealis F-4128]
MAPIKYYPSQIGSKLVTPLSFTASPIKLLLEDLWTALINLRYAPNIVLPLSPTTSGDLCELYPSARNLGNIALHVVLFFLQCFFLLSIPIWILMPVWVVAIGFTMFWVTNLSICFLLNGSRLVSTYQSAPEYAQEKKAHAHEQWLFLNGVCVGRHWLKCAVNRLALTFGRPVLGIHNRTNGVIFDILECLIQRSLNYASTDIRTAYRILKGKLYDPNITRIILVLHSQGAIEGSMIIDWLLAEIPQDLLQKLEVYTFGNAANHFNNPHLHLASQSNALSHPSLPATSLTRTITTLFTSSNGPVELPTNRNGNGKSIPHIEHYAHTYDFVSRFGVLHYHHNYSHETFAPRFMGRVFEVEDSGHMFVEHYLDRMFPLSKSLCKRLVSSSFRNERKQQDLITDANAEEEHVDENPGFMGSVVQGLGRVEPDDKLGREDWEVSYVGESGDGDEVENEDEEDSARSVSGKGNKNGKSSGKSNGNANANTNPSNSEKKGSLGSATLKEEGTILTNGMDQGELRRARAFRNKKEFKVKNLSRLWLYRNGKSPMN